MTTVYLNNSKWRLLDQCERGRIFLQLGQLYSSDRVCIEWTVPIEILVLVRGQVHKDMEHEREQNEKKSKLPTNQC